MDRVIFKRKMSNSIPGGRHCAICNDPLEPVSSDTWFFVGSPEECEYLCSRKCLVNYIAALGQGAVPPLAKIKHGGCHVITPHRRD